MWEGFVANVQVPLVHYFIKRFERLFYTEVLKWDLFNKEATENSGLLYVLALEQNILIDIIFRVPYARHYNPRLVYFLPHLISLFSKRFFHKTLSLWAVCNQERVMKACIRPVLHTDSNSYKYPNRNVDILCLVLLQVPKFFVPDQKFIYILWQSQTFCARQKDDLRSVKLVFVPAQKFLKRH